MNYIWCVKNDDEVRFSKDWIFTIFGQGVEHFDQKRNFNLFIDNSFIIWAEQKYNDEFVKYIEEYNNRNLNYVVIHLSDEIFDHDVQFYKVSKKTIRTLLNENYVRDYGVETIPVGFQTGVNKTQSPKNILINFAGQIKSDRMTMIESFRNSPLLQYCVFKFTNQWNDPNGLKLDEYSDLLTKSIFTLCPRGWVNIDSFRICEALECGSIPVSIMDGNKDYFSKIFGNHPFIIGEDWPDAVKIIQSYTQEDMIKKLKEIDIFWKEYKNNLKLKYENYFSR